MSFKLNDYNAFLTSLFDKSYPNGNKREVSEKQSQQGQYNGSNFPVDFDFGLMTPSSVPLNTRDTEQRQVQESHQQSQTMHYTSNETSPNTNFITSSKFINDVNSKGLINDNSYRDRSSIGVVPSMPSQNANQQFDPFSINYSETNGAIHPYTDPNQSSVFTNSVASPQSTSIGPVKSQFLLNPSIETEPLPQSPLDSHSIRPSKTRQRRQSRIKQDISEYNTIGSKTKGKSAHNVIEQRYRNKINDKFTALQNSVPTLRVAAKRNKRVSVPSSPDEAFAKLEDEDDDDLIYDYSSNVEEVDLEGLEPARKLNKGIILAKSIEYIKFLELKNDRMKLENEELLFKARMLGLAIDEDLIASSNNSNH